ncbi:hypothetical protein QUF50_01745 [Thiotrichales bacterium HSG1]|nr:hypothetical protein [Thiotrichales bacterium HSG1]
MELSKEKIAISEIKTALSEIFLHCLWFILTFIAGFIFHIFWLYIMNHKDFSFQNIILSGNLLLFLMAITASVFIDYVVFGEYLKNVQNASFRVALMGLLIMFLLSSCAVTLVQGRAILLQQKVDEFEFILAINITLLICTFIYAIITRFLSKKVHIRDDKPNGI